MNRTVHSKLALLSFACIGAALFCNAAQASIVQNGSLEDLQGNFVNSACSYMALGAGSTAISGWTVASSTTGAIVWAQSPTCDLYNAADGQYFVDLSGFGNQSPNGAIQQTLSVIGGATYSVSLDLATFNTNVTNVTVGSQSITLSPGSPFTVGTTSWTPWTGSFVGDPLDLNPILTVMNASPDQQIDFVDNIDVTGPSTSVPEPITVSLIGAGLAGAVAMRRRRKTTG
jgi:hypothetical protein